MQTMIKIVKYVFNNNGSIHNKYKIVNQKGKVVHYVVNSYHMEWILNGDYAEEGTDENYLRIQVDVFYDIDDEKFMKSVKAYINLSGTVTNYREMRAKCKFALVDYTDIYNYLSLSLGAKLVFLFEVVAMLETGEYLRYGFDDELALFLPLRSATVPVADVDAFFKIKGDLVDDKSNGPPAYLWVPK